MSVRSLKALHVVDQLCTAICIVYQVYNLMPLEGREEEEEEEEEERKKEG